MTRRSSRSALGWLLFVAAAIGFATAVPFAVNCHLAQQWPLQHDLSDIGTGLIRFLATLVSGFLSTAAAISVVVVRIKAVRARRRKLTEAIDNE